MEGRTRSHGNFGNRMPLDRIRNFVQYAKFGELSLSSPGGHMAHYNSVAEGFVVWNREREQASPDTIVAYQQV